MRKGKLFIVLIGLVLLPLVIILTIIGFRFQQWTQLLVDRAHEREISVEEIRPTFLLVTERELPNKADNLRAIFEEGRDPRIFVRFETDSEGIAYILQEFGGERVTSKTLYADDLKKLKRSDLRVFSKLSYWEYELGICLFDEDEIESCRVLEYRGYRGYKILIDDLKNTVYIYAYIR